MADYLSEYRPPNPQQLSDLEKAEDLYCQVESFIRSVLPPGPIRQQALFRLRESETWTKEGIKGVLEEEPAPRKSKGGYVIE